MNGLSKCLKSAESWIDEVRARCPKLGHTTLYLVKEEQLAGGLVGFHLEVLHQARPRHQFRNLQATLLLHGCIKWEGNIMAVGKNITWKKRERGSIIIFPIILRLLGRISRGEERKWTKILGKKINIFKNGDGEEYQVVRTPNC